MGKTPKPLVILALPPIHSWVELEELKAQGHTVATVEDVRLANVYLKTVDLILGPRCWRMDQAHRRYLPLAIKAGRQARYGPKGDEPS